MRTRSGEARHAVPALGLLLGALCLPPARAAEAPAAPREAAVGGHAVPLRGVGVSTKYTVDVCQVALYAPSRLADPQAIARSADPRRLRFHMLRDVSGEDFRQGLLALSEAQPREAASARTRANLRSLAHGLGERMGALSRGDVVAIDWVPGAGVTVSRNTQAVVPSVPDQELYQLLAELWMGAVSFNR